MGQHKVNFSSGVCYHKIKTFTISDIELDKEYTLEDILNI